MWKAESLISIIQCLWETSSIAFCGFFGGGGGGEGVSDHTCDDVTLIY